MFCVNCGEEIPEGSNVCPSCNTPLEVQTNAPIQNNVVPNINAVPNNTKVVEFDTPSKGLSFVSLVFPPIGIVYYFATKKDTVKRAKAALEAGIYGVVTYALAAALFIFLILPIEKKYALKYQCEKNTPGAVYDYKTYICKHPDGSEMQVLPK